MAKKIPAVGTRAKVYHGNAKHTSGGLFKKDLMKNRNGSIVSRKNSARAKKVESPLLKLWRKSVSTVYDQSRYSGKFVALKKGTPFYNAVKKEYKARMQKAGYSSVTGKKVRKMKAR